MNEGLAVVFEAHINAFTDAVRLRPCWNGDVELKDTFERRLAARIVGIGRVGPATGMGESRARQTIRCADY